MTSTDAAGASDNEIFEYVVVYDSAAGLVTGGGWIESPNGAYRADPGVGGRANFGFVSGYKPGAPKALPGSRDLGRGQLHRGLRNQTGAGDAAASDAIEGGSIVIHKK